MSEELRPCPFCGKEPRIMHYLDGSIGVDCETDNCVMGGYGSDNVDELLPESWNTRPIEDALIAQREQAGNSELNALEAYRRIEKERDALRDEVDAFKRMMDMNPSNVTTCMGKTLGYWIALERERDALRAKLEVAKEILSEIEIYNGDEDVTTLQGIICTLHNKARYALAKMEEK